MTEASKQKTKVKLNKNTDLIFTFNFANVEFEVDEQLYTDEEYKLLHQTINIICESISIDRSYVECKENKRENVFMTEVGWNKICKLVNSTKFGKKASREQNKALSETYCTMIIYYVYHMLDLLDYNVDSIVLYMTLPGKFMVEIEEDTLQEWKKYPGKWQTWENLS